MVIGWNGFEVRRTGGMDFQELFRRFWWPMLFVAGLVVVMWIVSGCEAFAGQIREEDAVRAIVGEAAGECGRKRAECHGMLAVAHAIRNRGTLVGVYGLGASHSKTEPAWVWKKARRAWAQASRQRSHDLTNGATHWESTDFKRPTWSRDMIVTVRIGKHVFYRERVKR